MLGLGFVRSDDRKEKPSRIRERFETHYARGRLFRISHNFLRLPTSVFMKLGCQVRAVVHYDIWLRIKYGIYMLEICLVVFSFFGEYIYAEVLHERSRHIVLCR